MLKCFLFTLSYKLKCKITNEQVQLYFHPTFRTAVSTLLDRERVVEWLRSNYYLILNLWWFSGFYVNTIYFYECLNVSILIYHLSHRHHFSHLSGRMPVARYNLTFLNAHRSWHVYLNINLLILLMFASVFNTFPERLLSPCWFETLKK